MANAQSPHEDLSGNTAIEKIKEIAESAGTCFFSTNVNNETKSRPMALQEVDEQGNLWFLSDVNSDKNQDIKNDSHVELYLYFLILFLPTEDVRFLPLRVTYHDYRQE